MVKEFTKRLRCSVQGCRERSKYAFGLRGNDYPVCEMHFEQLINEGAEILGKLEKPSVKDAEPSVTVIEEAPAVVEEAVPEEPAKEPEAVEPKEEITDPAEFFTCKWCGEKFDKSIMTTNEFASHSRSCKKEHGGVPFEG